MELFKTLYNSDKNFCGIYSLYCMFDGRFYIGSSKASQKRKRDHFNSLRNNEHPNSRLQNVWNKHGENSFIFLNLEECSPDKLLEKEQYWINFYNSTNKISGLNVNPTVGRPIDRTGYKMSDATKNKIGNSNKKSYLLINPSGEVVRISNGSKFCRDNGLDCPHFFEMISGRGSHVKNWRKAPKIAVEGQKFDIPNLLREESENKYCSKCKRTTLLQNGKEFNVVNISKFAREKGLDVTTMQRLASGKVKSCGGYILKYAI